MHTIRELGMINIHYDIMMSIIKRLSVAINDCKNRYKQRRVFSVRAVAYIGL